MLWRTALAHLTQQAAQGDRRRAKGADERLVDNDEKHSSPAGVKPRPVPLALTPFGETLRGTPGQHRVTSMVPGNCNRRRDKGSSSTLKEVRFPPATHLLLQKDGGAGRTTTSKNALMQWGTETEGVAVVFLPLILAFLGGMGG
eukprot:Hpha_TRINITY_DN16030_c2_g1::TRINITY_DN16030_c2_g1_i10::g.120865::m.120865